MSGHSKWSTIKRKKEKTDQQRAKVFTKIGRELAVVVKTGGPDPSVNAKLKDVIAKAKANNVPNDNIDRIIKKAAGTDDGNDYEEIVYEGYGPCGIAVIVETLTDNRNRTAGDLRHYFDKSGGNMGQPGSVMFLFSRQGQLIIESEGLSEDAVMEAALEAGADDFTAEGDIYIVSTQPNSLPAVRDAMEKAGFSYLSAEPAYVPSTYTSIEDPDMIIKMEKLLDTLEENDDVQNIWHNWEMPDSESD